MKKISIILLTIYCLFSSNKANAQWERVKSFTGGLTNAMAKDSNTIYACVNDFGLVKSIDDGDHWSFVNDTLGAGYGGNQYGHTSLSAEGNKVLIGVTYSIDSGASWTNITVPIPPGGNLQDTKIYKGKIFATDWWGRVYISGDDGATWKMDSLSNGINQIEIIDDRIFIVGSYSSALFMSLDTGNTWINLGSNGVSTYDSFSAKGDTLAIVSYTGLRISSNLGATWSNIPCSPLSNYTYPIVYFDNDTLYFINHDSIFNSYNLGVTWNFLAYKGGLRATSIIKTGNDFLIGSHNHAFVRFSPANNSTVKKAKEIYGTDVSDIKVKGDSLIVTTGDLCYYSYDNGITWGYSIPFANNYGSYARGPIAFDTIAIYACISNLVFRSADWGATWMPFDTLISDIIDLTCYNGKIFYATQSGVYTGLSQGGPAIKYGNLYTEFYGVAASNNRLFAINKKHIYSTNLDSNVHWTIATNGLPNSDNFRHIIAGDSAVFIGGNKGVYRCYPPDTTWSYTGLYQKYVRDLSCFHNDAFATSLVKGVTILRSDSGSVWDPINFGLNDYKPTQISAGDSFLFCGGNYHGLFRRLRDQVQYPTAINENNFIDDFYFSISPNPASDVVQITGNVQSGNAKLNLIDITGRICFTKTVSSKGNFSFNINANNFADGIYFLNMFDGNRKYSGKVLIQH